MRPWVSEAGSSNCSVAFWRAPTPKACVLCVLCVLVCLVHSCRCPLILPPLFFHRSGMHGAAASMMDPSFMQDAMEMMKDPNVMKQV